MNRMMVDLETMGDTPRAAIVSIGWAVFDHDYVRAAGKISVDLADSVHKGGEMTPSTVIWWLGQDELARQALLDPPIQNLHAALKELREWWSGYHCETVWSHGSTFDCVILDHAYRCVNSRTPWAFRDVRDTRTVFSAATSSKISLLYEEAARLWGGPKHDARIDAARQAWVIIGIEKQLGVQFH